MATGEQGKRAKDDAAAFAELKARLDEAKGALKGLQDAAQAELFAKNPIAKAKHDVEELAGKYRELAKAQKDATAAAASGAVGGGSKGPAALGDLKEGAGAALSAGSLLTAGGAALASGGAVVLGAAEKIASSAYDLGKAGLLYGIEASAARSKQKEILDKLTHGQGEIALQVRAELAGATGQSTADVGDQMKRLIQAHFNRGETEVLIKVAADISEVKAGAGDAFLGALEKLEHRGKATERDLRAITGAGLDLQRVLAELKGDPTESIDAVEARLKKGKVSADDFVNAAVKIAKQDFGGLAGHGLDAAVNRAKIGIKGLFSDFDISPLEAFADEVAETLKTPAAAELKKGIKDVADSVIGLVKGVSKEDVSGFFKTAASAAHELADDIRGAAHGVSVLVAALKSAKSGSYTALDEALATEEKKAPEPAAKPGYRGRTTTEHVGGDEVVTVGGANSAEDEARVKASKTGKAYGEGLAAGVDASAADAAAAGARAGDAVDKGARGALGVHSPSTVAEEVGGFYDKGLERGIDRNADGPENAAARLAGRVSRAGVPTASAGAAGASGGAGGGSVSITWAPVYQLSVGAPADIAATLREHDAAAYPKLLSQVRQMVRDARETGGPP